MTDFRRPYSSMRGGDAPVPKPKRVRGRAMTSRQRIHLMANLWPAACAAQGWAEGDRDRRLQVLSEAVGRPITSASDLDARSDYDKVAAHLNLLAKPDDFNAAMLDVDPARDRQRRRALWTCGQFPAMYVKQITLGFTHGVTDDWSELTTDQLCNLATTLHQRERNGRIARVQRERAAQLTPEIV